MAGQGDELVIDCRKGSLGEQGCQITVREGTLVRKLFGQINHLYEKGLSFQEHGDDRQDDSWDDAEPGRWHSVAEWLYEFDF